ncbi:MAG: hypothetical protein ACR2PF_12270, partial [Rhizobiaceae bacterium]
RNCYMKTLTIALLASAFVAGPALACSMNKTAEHISPYTKFEKQHEALTTFDPADKPAFEQEAKKVDTEEVIEDETAE